MKEELRFDRAGRDRVDADAARPELLGEDVGHGLDRRLGGGIDAVARLVETDDAGREGDDAATIAQPSRCFAHAAEDATEIERDLTIEIGIRDVGERAEFHGAGIVDENVDATECLFGGIEQRRGAGRFADIGLDGDGAAALRFYGGDDLLGLVTAPRIIDDNGETVPGKPLRHGGADAPRCAGDDGDTLFFHDAIS